MSDLVGKPKDRFSHDMALFYALSAGGAEKEEKEVQAVHRSSAVPGD